MPSRTFAYHIPGEESLKKTRKIREAFSTLEAVIMDEVPVSRELTHTMSNLQQSATWAMLGVVNNDPESQACLD